MIDEIIKSSWTVNLNEVGKEITCDDCDALTQLRKIYELDFDSPEINLIEAMKTLQDALVFVLETMDWKVGD